MERPPDRSRWWPRQEKGHIVPGAGSFALKVFLVSVSMLFGATIVAFLVIRYQAKSWWPIESGGLPLAIWISSPILFYSSVPLYRALRAARMDDQATLRRSLLEATALGFAFLAGQAVSWLQLWTTLRPEELETIPVFTFYMFSVTHALHVLGGLVPLCLVTRNAYRGRYDSLHHPGVSLMNLYWHFLAIVWAVLLLLLLTYA